MIVVLDTNVIISGILKPYSKAAAILHLVADGTIRLAYDLRLLSEYRDVLSRSKFNFAKENVEAFLDQVEQEGLLTSAKPLKIHLSDPDDEPFLEAALSAGAEAMITGNKHHFPKKQYEGVNPVRNSSGALNPAGIILKSNPAAGERGIISNGVEISSPAEFLEMMKEKI
jgi:putative PIN family toxin of toxin-antitoxin system